MMQVAAPDRDGLRRLAEIQLDRPLVLSIYLDLEPSQFALPRARASEVTSVLDEADRRARDLGERLSHEDRGRLQQSLERAREFLEGDLDAEGAHGLALFASEPAGLFEALKLPRGAGTHVAIDRAPAVGPLAGLERSERWCVTLVSRRDARIFRGSPEGLGEREALRDEVHGQHDQGGWSQARYQRHVEKEKDDHLRRTCEVLMRHFEREPFERLVLGGPNEVVADFEGKLHQYLAERLAGRIEVDVERANADEVLEAAGPLLERLEGEREAEALDRLGDPARGAEGLLKVLDALNERRVETLLLAPGYEVAGARCPRCGWLGPDGPRQCPADGTDLESRDDLVEPMIELAIQQSAEVLPFRVRDEELRERGGIGALLRF